MFKGLVEEAKAKLRLLLDAYLTRWRGGRAQAGQDLISLLLTDEARSDELVPPRRRYSFRSRA